MSNVLVRTRSIRSIHLPIPLLRRSSEISDRHNDWPVTGPSSSDETVRATNPAAVDVENGLPASSWRPEANLAGAAPRKSVSKWRMLLMLTLLLTGAAVMKILTMTNRGREFHPNWVAHGSKTRGNRSPGG